MNRKIKQSIITVIITSLVLMFMNIEVVNAATIYDLTCRIKVFPYNINAQDISGPSSEQYLNTIPDADCSNHLPFSKPNNYNNGDQNPYTPQNPISEQDNPLNDNAANIMVSGAKHQHAFYNDTVADNFYHKAFLKEFEITVSLDDDGDGILNVDKNHMVCDMPLPAGTILTPEINTALIDCQTLPNQKLSIYGGTTISKRDLGNNKMKIVWTFGANNDDNNPPPAIWGANGNGFIVYDLDANNQAVALPPLNLDSDPNQRTLGKNGEGFIVNLFSMDGLPQNIWSATTTSRAKIQDYKIKKNTYGPNTALLDDSSANGWSAENRQHWVNIGSVASIWRRSTPETPPETPTANLTLIKKIVDADGAQLPNQSAAHIFTLYAEKTDDAAAQADEQNTTALRASPRAQAQRTPQQSDAQAQSPARPRTPAAQNQNVGTRPNASPLARPRTSILGGDLFGLSNLLDGISIDTAEMHFALGERKNFRTGDIKVVDGDATYTIGEEQKDGYTLNSISCTSVLARGPQQLGADHKIHINADSNVTCTLTNGPSSGNTKTCPDGREIPADEDCDITPPPVECGEGESLNAAGQCVPDVPDVPTHDCGEGQFFNGIECVPVPPISPVCPPGFFLDIGGGCMPFSPPSGGIPAGRFNKSVRTLRNFSGSVINVGETAEYNLTFTSTNRAVSSVKIRDESFGYDTQFIGDKGGVLRLQPNYDGKLFRVVKRISDNSQPYEVPRCNEGPALFLDGSSSCFTGEPVAGVEVTNILQGSSVSVELTAQLIDSNIGHDFCNKQIQDKGFVRFCGEQFHNVATAVDNEQRSYTDSADLFTPCPYFLTRGIGDVILEQGFNYGSDITSCFALPNIEGEIIQPIEPIDDQEIDKTGAGDEDKLIPSNEICKKSNDSASDNPGPYKNPFNNLSSGLCELKQSISESLTSNAIRQTISDNIVRFTRENANLNIAGKAVISGEDINEVIGVTLGNPNNKVYKRSGNLTINITTPVAKGSRTFIVQNGDLIIKNDIKFDEQAVGNASFKETPSIAFIVIGGDIKIDPSVKHLDGVYVAIKDPKKLTGPGGTITTTGGDDKNNPLEFNGAVVGDIEPLFKSRKYAGNAHTNQGTIVINYGAWLYYNLPPVLRDLVDLQQEQTAR